MRRLLKPALAAIALAGAIWVSARGVGQVPPLGPLLDPWHGVWSMARAADPPRQADVVVPGVQDQVRVLYDDRGVPHIFASSLDDAYRALGYVVARDRLFQLDVQWRAGAGRLTELVGARALSIDQQTRRVGLPASAARKWAALDSSSVAWRAIHAYADGVNAYMDAMRAGDLPIEYRLLGVRPARWEPINSMHLWNRMGMTLAYNPTEMLRMRAAAQVGWEATDVLFPPHSPVVEPIQPGAGDAPRFEWPAIPPPGNGAEDARESTRIMDAAIGELFVPYGSLEPGTLGSNSWAVSGRRSASGHALLAGDPHLELTLPSIWYEVHIVVPGEVDVYGGIIPGSPWVLIGFNRDIAWTFTNHDADVLDYYREAVNDERAPTSYLLDGEWEPVERRVERYRDAEGRVIATDTVRFTHRGPMRRVGEQWLSMRWTVHDPWSDERVLPAIARARSAREFHEITADWVAPSQNMLVADRGGSIAVRSAGAFPVRPAGARGDTVQDGRSRRSDWTGFRAPGEDPQSVDPAQGYIATANQQSLDPVLRSGYFGSVWPSPWRALRINQLLRADGSVTPERMREWQTDPGSVRADLFVPAFLSAAASRGANGDDSLRAAAALLGEWDRRYTKENRRAVLFEAAMQELASRTWDELVPGDASQLVANPGDLMIAALLRDPANAWWDDRRTPVVETRDEVLAASLRAGFVRVVAVRGPPDDERWRWDQVQHANIWHSLQLPQFSSLRVPVQGGPGLLNPSAGNGRHGASLRLVVELGDELRAWGTYPGGQSGNPLSPAYRDRLAKWSAGELDALLVPRTADELPQERMTRELRIGGGR